eukprot:jgi/Hompol1/5885/HPOL_000184-RA
MMSLAIATGSILTQYRAVSVNIFEGSPENRRMTTGLHIVRDIFCTYCQTVVGWKYDKAFEKSQEYKEGHYILERELIYEV